MTAGTLTLTDFLLARIAEDEAHAGSWYALHVDHDPQAWVLAECDAKRRIVDVCEDWWGAEPCGPILRALALPYADHPDYRDEWKP